MKSVKLDLLIIGGGVAGLWSMNRARTAGYSVLLLEPHRLGGGQTICAQGIIHGGAKYSLTGSLSQATQSIADMPQRWFSSLQGEGEIDLRKTRQLSDTHYLWSINKLSSKVTTFFASKAMKNKAAKVKFDGYPEAFCHSDFKGNLYALNERVVDVPSLIRNLSEPCLESIARVDVLKEGRFVLNDQGQVTQVELPAYDVSLEPQRILFACGEAFNSFRTQLPLSQIQMQKRPLHMLMVRHEEGPSIYAHAIGASSKPLMTITSHPHSSGDQVWHIGGLVAEEGVALDEAELIAKAKQQLADYLPWIQLKNPRWSTYRVNRAEPEMQGQVRPDAAFMAEERNMMVAWPTKLALAPQLSDLVITALDALTERHEVDFGDWEHLPKPDIATPLWEQE